MAFRGRLKAGVAAAALAAILTLAACGESAEEGDAAAAADPSAVAALVNGSPIYVSDVELEGRVQGLIEQSEKLEVDSAEFNEILDQLIDIKLLAMEATSRGLDEEPESRHRLQTARDNILGNILVDTVVSERVDEAAIKKMYEAQIAIWELGDEAHLRHIVAPTREDIDKTLAELKGGADFAVLASKKSADEATRMEGGDLGFMTEEEATPEFAKVIRETPTGGVSKPFQTDMGWHVVKIDERRKERPPSIEELRGPILKHLTMMQIGDVLKELRQEAKIDKQTSPRNSTLDVDSFELPDTPPRQAAPAAPPAALETPVERPPIPDAAAAAQKSAATPTTPATTTPAKPPATTTAKPPAAAPTTAAKPPAAAPTTTAKPAAPPATTNTPSVTTPPPAATQSPTPPPGSTPQPSGPVSESREGTGQ
ncbi:MAG: peptidylprolyl isomerase [Hyphomonadaceae bacterium]|nr:peptidylprolyl isomerase [Hyphomonadaceae bacterium]